MRSKTRPLSTTVAQTSWKSFLHGRGISKKIQTWSDDHQSGGRPSGSKHLMLVCAKYRIAHRGWRLAKTHPDRERPGQKIQFCQRQPQTPCLVTDSLAQLFMSLYFSYQSDKRTLCPETQKHKTGHVIAMEKKSGTGRAHLEVNGMG